MPLLEYDVAREDTIRTGEVLVCASILTFSKGAVMVLEKHPPIPPAIKNLHSGICCGGSDAVRS